MLVKENEDGSIDIELEPELDGRMIDYLNTKAEEQGISIDEVFNIILREAIDNASPEEIRTLAKKEGFIS